MIHPILITRCLFFYSLTCCFLTCLFGTNILLITSHTHFFSWVSTLVCFCAHMNHFQPTSFSPEDDPFQSPLLQSWNSLGEILVWYNACMKKVLHGNYSILLYTCEKYLFTDTCMLKGEGTASLHPIISFFLST